MQLPGNILEKKDKTFYFPFLLPAAWRANRWLELHHHHREGDGLEKGREDMTKTQDIRSLDV